MSKNESPKQDVTKHVSNGGVTQDQFNKWSEEPHGCNTIIVKSEKLGEMTCYVKDMDRPTFGAVMMHMDNKMKDMAGETALQNCWLGGDDRLRNPRGVKEEFASIAAGFQVLKTIDIPNAQILKN